MDVAGPGTRVPFGHLAVDFEDGGFGDVGAFSSDFTGFVEDFREFGDWELLEFLGKDPIGGGVILVHGEPVRTEVESSFCAQVGQATAMSKKYSFASTLIAVLSVFVCCNPSPAAVKIEWEVQNNTGVDANDVHVYFKNWMEKGIVTLTHNGPPAKNGVPGKKTKKGKWGGALFSWDKETLGTVKPGQKVTFRAEDKEKRLETMYDHKKSYWTVDENPVTEKNDNGTNKKDKYGNTVYKGFTSTDPIKIAKLLERSVEFQFANSNSFPIEYTDIRLYQNNDMANFSLDAFTDPTGSLVTEIPASILLENQGDTSTVAVAGFDPEKYLLAVADVHWIGTNTIFSVATAVTVPVGESLLGDLNEDSAVNAVDIDLLRLAINIGSADPIYDVNGGGLNDTDLNYQVETIIGSAFGDADLNQQVHFTDFASLSTNFGSNRTGWGEGNFNLDDVTNFADFVVLANNYGADLNRGEFTKMSVPEPASLVLLSLAVGFVTKR